jgi:type II secretion system protein H
MKSFKKRRAGERGFSIIELLVVVVIMTAVLAASIPALRGHAETVSLRKASTDIAGTLKLARQRSVAVNRDVIVVFDEVDDSYYLFEDTDGDGTFDSGETQAGPYDLPKRVVLADVSFASDEVTFRPGGSASETGSIIVVNSRDRGLQIDLMATTGLVYISDIFQYEGELARGD